MVFSNLCGRWTRLSRGRGRLTLSPPPFEGRGLGGEGRPTTTVSTDLL